MKKMKKMKQMEQMEQTEQTEEAKQTAQTGAEPKMPASHGETFQYSYSAAEQTEVRKIREKYLPTTEREDRMRRLRRLDAKATRTALAISLCVGILGTLLLGVGLCCVMLPDWQTRYFVPGIVVGVIGIACIAAAYPLHGQVLRRTRAKLAPEILRLSEELLK